MNNSNYIKVGVTIVGLILGYFYWNLYACTEGCAITGYWYGSMGIGGIFGYLVGGIIIDTNFKK